MILLYSCTLLIFLFFFFNDTATTEIYTLSLHDALPISEGKKWIQHFGCAGCHEISGLEEEGRIGTELTVEGSKPIDRKSTRLNSSHSQISYAVFCLKKKKKK